MELYYFKNLKKNRKRLDYIISTSLEPSTPSYRYDRLYENSDLDTTIFLPPNFDTSIQTQLSSASDASASDNAV